MISRLKRVEKRSRLFFVLFIALSFLLAGNGMAGWGSTTCQAHKAAGRMQKPHSSHGSCRCCGKEQAGGENGACPGLTVGCGSDSANRLMVSPSNGESPTLDSSPAFAHPSLPTFSKMGDPQCTFEPKRSTFQISTSSVDLTAGLSGPEGHLVPRSTKIVS